jgi:HEAT repeats
MPVQLQPQTQDLVDTLLYAKENAVRNEALQKIVALPDKDQVETYILEQLDSATERWPRTWSLSVLAEIGSANGTKKVLDHTFDPPESDAWARHFALINAANFEPFPMAQIEKATKDHEVLPKATAFRLLLANGHDKYADDLLAMLWDESVPDSTWAAARVLRNRSEMKMKPLRNHIEGQFIEPLVKIASDSYIYLDTRWEAIQALASFIHRKSEVASLLGDLLVKDTDATLRRFYLEALLKLNQPNESQVALIKAVEDSDAQIRLDAATALKTMLGAERSIQLLLPSALEREKNTALLVDALRDIDSDLAAKAIRDALSNPDTQVSTRANQLLTQLGGQVAAQILMNERAKALKNYTDILNDADKDVREHFKELMSQAKFAFWLSLGMHIVVFIIGVWVLIVSLSLAVNGGLTAVSTWVGVGGAGASALVILLSAFYRNPLQNVRSSLNSLMQVDVVFLGYVRQINQIDATFKHMFLDARDFGTQQMKATVAEIQSSVTQILEEIQKHIQSK